jgi:transposase
MVETGLSAQRIFQDLRAGHGFCGSYSSIKRFVAKLRTALPERVWRVECEPGQELQIDFMAGPMLPDGSSTDKRKRCWILRAVLSHSRKGYSEAVWRQDSESFLRALENALRAFGGVPTLLNVDNLKAAITKADWCDPELSPKFAEFCRHYGMTPMPCRPYCPQHKGKVERSVHYVRHNALVGHRFESLSALNAHLRQWEATVADTRIHGTTRQQVGAHFQSVERAALKTLPIELFSAFTEVKRTVHRDSYVEVAKAYYQAPPEYIGHNVWVRYDGRQVRLLNARFELIATHRQLDQGGYSQVRGVGGLDQRGSLEDTARYWLNRAKSIGPAAGQWAQRALEERDTQALRSLMGLWGLRRKHSAPSINAACTEAALASSANPSLKAIRQRLKETKGAPCQSLMPLAAGQCPIRELSDYSQFIENQNQKAHEPHCHTEDPSPSTAA